MRHKTVYFHIDELARDAVVAANLKSILYKQKVKLVYGNRLSSSILRTFDPFDIVILPSLGMFQFYYPDLSNIKSKIVILPTEAVGQATKNISRINAKYFGNEPVTSKPWFDAVSAFCLWGYDHLRCFQEIRPDAISKCHTVGHPRFDKRCIRIHSNSNRKSLDNRLKVGIISRFSLVNDFDNRNNLQIVFEGMKRDGVFIPKYENSPNHNIEDLFYTEIQDLRILIQLLEELDKNRLKISLRVHPREDRYAWIKLLNRIGNHISLAPWDEPFIHWACEQDFLIGPPSTSFYDCFIIGKKPICTMNMLPNRANHILTESDDNNLILNFVHKPNSMNELMDILNKDENRFFNVSPELHQMLNGQVCLDICSNSLVNIANICVDMLNKLPDKNSLIIAKSGYFFINYLKKIKTIFTNIFIKKTEQSSSFRLSYKRIKFIDRLTNDS